MDPLVVLDQAVAKGNLPRAMGRKAALRMKYLTGAVERVEKASGLDYPPYYVEPTLPLSRGGGEYGQTGVLYARVLTTTATGRLSILVQFTAALIVFGSKATLEAVAAHEFTHYVDLVRRLSKTDVVSEERATTLYEASFADVERTVPPKLLFSEKALVALVSRKFKDGLTDPTLNRKVESSWIAKNLPVRWAATEENVVRLSMAAVMSARFDPKVVARAAEIEEKMKA
jgi:hypothetical protein